MLPKVLDIGDLPIFNRGYSILMVFIDIFREKSIQRVLYIGSLPRITDTIN